MNLHTRKCSIRDAVVEEVIGLATEFNVVVVDCDFAKHTRFDRFASTFPQRFYQAGISEQHAISLAAGIAATGRTAIVTGPAAFLLGRGWEQLRHCIAFQNSNVKLFCSHVGVAGAEDGFSHQIYDDLALVGALPAFLALSPIDATEARKMCRYAIQKPGPVYLRMGRRPIPLVTPHDYEFRLGLPVIVRKARNLTVASTGELANACIEAIQSLAQTTAGFDVGFVHFPTIEPFIAGEVRSALDGVDRLLVFEEHSRHGGLTTRLMDALWGFEIDISARNIPKGFGESGSDEELLAAAGLDHEALMSQIHNSWLSMQAIE